ncbi:ATP-grasp fold amidoligase family protein [Sutcliffiella sp. BMC8]
MKRRFLNTHKYNLNLDNPKSFNEKIQWIKINGNLERFTKYTDKYEVRNYVKEKLGEAYLVPLIGIFEDVSEIPYKELPNAFVMKATHGSGWNIVITDKGKVDWKNECLKMKKWLATNFYVTNSQKNYNSIKPRIIIEEYLEDPSGDLKDYKFFCFEGKPHFIQINGEKSKQQQRNLYNTEWVKLDVKYKFDNFAKQINKPKSLNKMLNIASVLSKPFGFVRVDLYNLDNIIKFGELTFTPINGYGKFTPTEFDFELGSLLNLKKYLD